MKLLQRTKTRPVAYNRAQNYLDLDDREPPSALLNCSVLNVFFKLGADFLAFKAAQDQMFVDVLGI